jgi:hypothetical protein
MISQSFTLGFELFFARFLSQRLKIAQPRADIGFIGSMHRVKELLGRNYQVTVRKMHNQVVKTPACD